MYKFSEWLRKKGIRVETFDDAFNPTDKFKFNSKGDIAGDYEKDLHELTKVVMAKYQTEFTRWLAQIADERNDGEVKDLLKKVRTDSSDSSTPWATKDEEPEFVAPKADRANDPNGPSEAFRWRF